MGMPRVNNLPNCQGAKEPLGMENVQAATTCSAELASVLSAACGFHHLLLGSPVWQSGYLHVRGAGSWV
jgi:hypothetical protein